jgi:DNA-binding transcriptional LysR family regulator
MDFRLKQLQSFLALAGLRNFRKASQAVYVSQPTLTFQIKSLEEALGVKLFERSRQHVALTDAGIAFGEYAETILKTAAKAQAHLGALQNRLRLRISCGPVGQYVLLSSVLRSLAACDENFQLELCELTTEEQLARLPMGGVDALFMVGALPIPGMRFDPISKETLVAMVSRHSPLARRKQISVYDLRDKKIIASRAEECRFHQPFLHQLFEPFGIVPRILEVPYSCAVQLAYAGAGEGIVLATASMMKCTFPDVVAVPFAEELPELQLGIAAMESNKSPALDIFRQVAVQCFAAVPDLISPPKHRPYVPAPTIALGA